jgi:cell wall-associated NlpC family hydrolase
VASPASAGQLSTLQAQAQSLAKQIQTLGNQEDALSEQYDGANVKLQKDRTEVAAAAKDVAQADAAAGKAKAVLKTDAINAYIHDGTAGASGSVTGGSSSLSNADNGLLRAEYVSSLATDQSDDQDQFHLASVQAQAAHDTLSTAQTAAQKQVNTLSSDRAQVSASESKLEGVEGQVKGQIATLVAQIQAQQEAAAQAAATAAANARQAAAAQAAAAAQQAAAQQQASAAAVTAASPNTDPTTAATDSPDATTTVDPDAGDTTDPDATTTTTLDPTQDPPATDPTTTIDPTTTTTPPTQVLAEPPASGVGAAALAEAATQIGVPYVWGGDTPSGGFDCSGLVQWAFAQVGVSLPHYSGSQFSDGTQIPMSDLEPGDLVFFSDPGEHVAFYAGGGEVLQAPETGEDVGYAPMDGEFTLAVRIS